MVLQLVIVQMAIIKERPLEDQQMAKHQDQLLVITQMLIQMV